MADREQVNSKGQTSRQLMYFQVRGEKWLLKLKLLILAVLCVFLGAFLVAFKVQAHIQNFGAKHDCLLPEHNDDLKNYSWILSENKDNMKLQEEMNKLIKVKDDCIKQLETEKNNFTQVLQEKDERIKQLQTKNDELCTNLKGWTYFRGKCYYVSTDWKTWTASRHACRAKGGDLLIIESEEEQEFIKALGTYKEDYWIGLTNAVKEGDWRWLDGTKLSTRSIHLYYDRSGNCGLMRLTTNTYYLKIALCNVSYRNFKHVCEAKAPI
ncbi:uncharacterized protein [Salminus brasiliensis]|uniref:uncharacterized protein n=1 Tax=Salminus brasiliensis TaxID=930266 RepID=UPI003B833BA8